MTIYKAFFVLFFSSLAILSGCKKSVDALNDQVETPVDTQVTVFLTGTANYDFQDWDEYQVTPPQNGTLSGTGYKRVYTPDAGFTGTDSIRFRLGHKGEYTNEAEIRVHVGETTGRVDRFGFEDYALRACVRREAGKAKVSYVNELTSLSCSGSVLLVGGTKYPWLNDVYDNCINCDDGIKLASLHGLDAFSQLAQLSVSKGEVSDLSPLVGLTALTHLALPEVAADQVPMLQTMTQLTVLAFDSSALQTLEGITGLSSLTSLDIGNIREESFDLNSIANAYWPSLARLELAGVISDFTGLKTTDLGALTELRLSAYTETNLAGIDSLALPLLEQLSLELLASESLYGLTGNNFTQLRELSILGYRILDLSQLKENEWSALETLSLTGSLDMTDLSGTENLALPTLTMLDLQGIRNLADVTALLTWDMPQVETIQLTTAAGTLPCSEKSRVEARFPEAEVRTNVRCLE